MKTIYKVLISFSVGICLIVAGVGIGGLGYLYPIPFIPHVVWHPHSEENIRFEATEEIDNLKLELHKANVEFYTHQSHSIQVEVDQVYSGFEVYVDGHELKIIQPNYWWFSQYDAADIRIYLPEHFRFSETDVSMSLGWVQMNNLKTDDLKIDSYTGDFEMNDIQCQKLDLDAGVGSTKINHLSFQNQLDIDLGVGSVYVLLDGHEDEYSYNVDVGLGDVMIGDRSFSGIVDTHLNKRGHKNIDVDCGLGSVDIEMEAH